MLRDDSCIDRRPFMPFSHYTQLMRLTRSTRCRTHPRISSVNHPIKQHLACVAKQRVGARVACMSIRQSREVRCVERSRVAVSLRNALYLGSVLYSNIVERSPLHYPDAPLSTAMQSAYSHLPFIGV